MSKSDPDSAIFMEDTREDIHRKISNAYCPREVPPPSLSVHLPLFLLISRQASAENSKTDEEMRLVEDDLQNPCLDYLRYIILPPEVWLHPFPPKGCRRE
jgi:tyrosyl-tRNA synthetase